MFLLPTKTSKYQEICHCHLTMVGKQKDVCPPYLALARKPLGPDLLTNPSALQEVEYYANALNNKVTIPDILEGGIRGSAVLKHELVEVNALETASFDIHNPTHIDEIINRFEDSQVGWATCFCCPPLRSKKGPGSDYLVNTTIRTTIRAWPLSFSSDYKQMRTK